MVSCWLVIVLKSCCSCFLYIKRRNIWLCGVMGCKNKCFRKSLKLAVAVVCAAGFIIQTLEFMNLYWTYPTVVDIQVSIPSEIELPGISICNANGLYPGVICSLTSDCTVSHMHKFIDVCGVFPLFCHENGTVPERFRGVLLQKFSKANQLNATTLALLRKPLSEFMKCKIVSDSRERPCNLDDAVLGSYYSETYFPNFCFTINSLWSQPEKKIEKIKKSERISMEFYIDIVDGIKDPPLDLKQRPMYTYPSNIAVQLAIHSPYISASPYASGQTFLGGKKYEIKLKMDEKHLLPSPYQTNCTDYVPAWKSRDGVGPLNQLMVIQECKLNASLEKLGCVPLTVDYPHNEDICAQCETCIDVAGAWDHCTDLLQIYNQPCSFLNYDMEVEEKVVLIEKEFKSSFIQMPEKIVFREMGYNCTADNILTRRCQTLNIEVVFDDFEITKITYNPKFESLEVFSVIGGYMGMYLGISIVAMYDFAEMFLLTIYKFWKKRKAEKKKLLLKNSSKDRVFNTSRFNRDLRRRTPVYLYRERY